MRSVILVGQIYDCGNNEGIAGMWIDEIYVNGKQLPPEEKRYNLHEELLKFEDKCVLITIQELEKGSTTCLETKKLVKVPKHLETIMNEVKEIEKVINE